MPWLISHFPELDHLDPAQRAQLLKQLPWWTYPQIASRAIVIALVAGGITAAPISNSLALKPILICCAVVATAVAILMYRRDLNSLRRVMRREIAKGFAGQHPPFCFACGYNLTNLTAENCPECGKRIVGDDRAV